MTRPNSGTEHKMTGESYASFCSGPETGLLEVGLYILYWVEILIRLFHLNSFETCQRFCHASHRQYICTMTRILPF